MGVFGTSSFYEKERERIAAIIEEPLLIQVIQHLPHLQLTVEEQESKWELVAISVNNYHFSKAFEKEHAKEHIEIPTLNGHYLKEMFENLDSRFSKSLAMKRASPRWNPDPDPSDICDTRSEFLLYELYKMKGFDARTLAEISQEHYKNEQRLRFEKALQAPQADAFEVDETTKKVIDEFKDASQNIRLQAYEKELTKKNKKLEQLASENKKLLELNHDLLGGRFQDQA